MQSLYKFNTSKTLFIPHQADWAKTSSRLGEEVAFVNKLVRPWNDKRNGTEKKE
jgi:hypothetical protein